ncbi:MAG: DUF5615 family PIN-like protein [Cyanobacteria bacterium P01_D01_bin.1]
MSQIRLYIDEDSMEQSLVSALRARNIDVLTVNDTKTSGQTDEAQLRRAALDARVLYSHNIADFCKLHKAFISNSESHAGIVLLAQDYSIGNRLKALSALVLEYSSEDMFNQLRFLSQFIY